jgi:cyclopropane-fatty-acyl-phospholipid synthase
MSHESLQPGRAVVYHLPTLFSDSLRSLQFSQFFDAYRGAPFAVRTIDGWSWNSPGGGGPECIAQFRSRADLDAVLGDASEAALGRIFLNGRLEIHGNIFALLAVAEYALLHSEGLSSGMVQTLFRITSDMTRRLQRVRGTAIPQNWQCAPCPLDLPPEFFAPWLGPAMVHCCGSFRNASADLEAAQIEALERACGWLDLSAGDELLDVGCAWGSLSVHAARQHYADAFGITASQPQAEWAAQRIACSELRSRCHVECRDLRRSPYPAASFHKVATLGIFEQVPSGSFGKYLACVKKMLAPGGLLLLHRMTPTLTSGAHLRTLHPGLPTEPLSRDLALAEAGGWELVNVETMQRDYEETLRIWIGRLRQSSAELSHPFAYGYRAWLLYLVEIATSLHAEELQVHRVLLRRPSRARALVC